MLYVWYVEADGAWRSSTCTVILCATNAISTEVSTRNLICNLRPIFYVSIHTYTSNKLSKI